jgi:hypothetical protein
MASKRAQRRKACTGKIQYATVAQATAAKYKVIERFNDRMSAYRCRFCGQWHLGHTGYSRRA